MPRLFKMSSALTRFCCCSKFQTFSSIKSKYVPFRTHWRYTKKLEKNENKIEYLLVLDFEATCEENTKIIQEIIEFPCLKVSTTSFNVVDRFHEYVRPVVIPELSIFCIELTGILQDYVDGAHDFPEVLKRFEVWRTMNNLTENNSLYVTSGDWDLGRMLPTQCDLSGVPIPKHFQSWIDLKKLYAQEKGYLPKSLIEMIRKCGMQFQGRQHSGIDDCLNITNVLRSICKDRPVVYRPTSILRPAQSTTGYKVIFPES